MAKNEMEKNTISFQEKVSKKYNLHDCPRCNNADVMEFPSYQFDDSDFLQFAKCSNCGLELTHIFKWINTEIKEVI